ncbi:MAG: beta-N-acetylhexosaminidase [Candidatus Marinamargulisbacteria bacterium]
MPKKYAKVFLIAVCTIGCLLGVNVLAASTSAVDRLTLDQKIGQVFMVGMPFNKFNESRINFVRDYNIGGVMLKGPGSPPASRVRAITRSLQRTSLSGIPVLIAVDQEGGKVNRLRNGFTHFPNAMAIGATQSIFLAKAMGEAVGKELNSVGIHINFAPVMDVNNNPNNPVINVRSFSANPDMVASLGAAYIEGLQSAGVLATAKHFPGHGDTDLDSHTSEITSEHHFDRLENIEMKPFIAAVKNNVSAIMTSHIRYNSLDPNQPASLSYPVVNSILRRDLNFKGLIITDDLSMKAITDTTPLHLAAIQAFNAGADIVLMVGSVREFRRTVEKFKRAIRTGIISKERLNESVGRILAVKKDLPERKRIKAKTLRAHSNLAREISRKSVTMFPEKSLAIPLPTSYQKTILIVSRRKYLSNLLSLQHPNHHHIRLPRKMAGDDFRDMVDTLKKSSSVVFVIRNKRDANLVFRLQKELTFPCVVINLSDPSFTLGFDKKHSIVLTYSSLAIAIEAAAEVLQGKRKALGQNPMIL